MRWKSSRAGAVKSLGWATLKGGRVLGTGAERLLIWVLLARLKLIRRLGLNRVGWRVDAVGRHLGTFC